jgi:hypothetical protein
MHSVQTEKEALAYLLDCQLATVEQLALRKSPPLGELDRHKIIAKKALDFCIKFGVDISSTRGHDVVTKADGSVDRWARECL